jgi:adenylate cyclase
LTEYRAERRLAAILAADVAGYSRLMGADEEGTLSVLKAHRRELVDPKIAEHRGRIVKTTGDGLLVEFASAVDAVRCAADIQRGMAERNAALPRGRSVQFRIGINVGDVVIEDDDIFGDGVNIAARLEGVAEPGGICLSEDAYRQIKGKLRVDAIDTGEQQLKNIAQPVRVYKLRSDLPSLVPTATPALTIPDKPSIAVLAFQNMSGDTEQEYFADGIAEDIITALSKSRWLFVIARNSSFAYKGRDIDIKQIGCELGVRYVLEGSVRKVHNRVRISGQLIEAATGAHLWAERFDRDLADIFAVQDEITQAVSSAIEPVMAQAERQRTSRKAPDSLTAWEAYQRGLWHFMKQEPSENEHAKRFFGQAIDLDRNFAPGYYGLALSHLWDAWVWASRPVKDCLDVALPLAHRALTLDDADPNSHFAAGVAFGLEGDSESGLNEFQRVISLNPNHAWAIATLGNLYGFNGQPEEGLAALNKAIRISPHDPLMWAWVGWVSITHYFARNYQSALDAAERVVRLWPDKPHAYRWKAAALGQLGRATEARIALDKAIELFPANFQLYVRTRPPWIRPADHSLQLEGLIKAGLPNEPDPSRRIAVAPS